MGFSSPAADYVEDTLTVTKLCRMDANSRVVKTDSGYAILDMSLRPEQGDFILIRYDGMTDFGRLMGQSFITRDGEASRVKASRCSASSHSPLTICVVMIAR